MPCADFNHQELFDIVGIATKSDIYENKILENITSRIIHLLPFMATQFLMPC